MWNCQRKCHVQLMAPSLMVLGTDWSFETEAIKKLSQRSQKVVKNKINEFCGSVNGMVTGLHT